MREKHCVRVCVCACVGCLWADVQQSHGDDDYDDDDGDDDDDDDDDDG